MVQYPLADVRKGISNIEARIQDYILFGKE